MKKTTKMLLMGSKRGREYHDYGPRNDYGYGAYMRQDYGSNEYDVRGERSGSRGYPRNGDSYPIYPMNHYPMEEYPMGNYPMGNYQGEAEGRFRNRGGRRRDEAGRFVSGDSHYPAYPFVPPVYDRGDRGGRDGGGAMNRIGFALPYEMESNYGSRIENPHMNEGAHHKGEMMPGHASSRMKGMPFTHETAMAWVDQMENADGTHGAHWTMEQTKELQEKKGISHDPVEFFAAMNMMYSDYCKIAKRYNVNTADFYASMAKAFLDDKDAAPDKLAKYYEYVVEH